MLAFVLLVRDAIVALALSWLGVSVTPRPTAPQPADPPQAAVCIDGVVCIERAEAPQSAACD
jgi:hypothetical protein